jgi:hypothetical protein
MYLTLLKDIATLIGGLVLLLTFIKGTIEYARQGTQKRVELFLTIEKSFRENASFQEIRNLIVKNNPEVSKIPKKLRSDYAGFFELIALLTNSGLLKKEVACYMLAADAILCWENEHFWKDFDKSDQHWGLLRIFVQEMKNLKPKLKITKRRYSL